MIIIMVISNGVSLSSFIFKNSSKKVSICGILNFFQTKYFLSRVSNYSSETRNMENTEETVADVNNEENTKLGDDVLDKNALKKKIDITANYVKRLKVSNADSDRINTAITELKKLKARYFSIVTENGNVPASDSQVILKPPKGSRDFGPEQMAIRNKVINDICKIFIRHGAVTIDTPIFELKEVLTGKYGEESKLIYDLADQGGELLSLRYDLTVPFARYLAMNKIKNIKRYHIGKVYRRDNPAMTRGRYREFFQCDFDIAGQYDSMVPDVECVRIVSEILSVLDVGEFCIKVNHRSLLDGLFEACKIPTSKFKTICSSIDKLDKEPWENVRQEITKEKGLTNEEADKIGSYVKKSGKLNIVEELLNDQFLMSSTFSKTGLEDLKLFLKYCSLFDIEDKILFDFSLARGLDYYTGLIYEAVLESSVKGESIGSVAAGGRYDNLVGMFDAKNKNVPCVGISIGVERLFSVMEAKLSKEKKKVRTVETQVYVASATQNLLEERMKICCELWNHNINSEQSYKKNPRLLQQLQHCEEHQIPFAVIIGESELKDGVVKVRNILNRKEEEIPRSNLIHELNKRLAITMGEE